MVIRAGKLNRETRNELDLAISRAVESNHLEQLRMLKSREISPSAFLEAARQNRLLALAPSVPLKPLVEQWLRQSDLRPSSKQRYEQSWRFVWEALGQDAKLNQLTVNWWSGFVLGRQVKNTTSNRDRAAVLSFLSWAKEHQYQVPDFTPKKLKEEPKGSAILTPEQVQRVLKACRPDRLPFFQTLLETGCRQGELLNLRLENLGNGVITFTSQPGSKSRGKTRHVPISQELSDCLTVLGTVQNGRVFPYSRSTIRDWWAELCTELGIKGVTLHGLRATAITRALDSAIAPVQIQKLVGHSNLNTTMRYYRNGVESQEAAQAMRVAVGFSEKVF